MSQVVDQPTVVIVPPGLQIDSLAGSSSLRRANRGNCPSLRGNGSATHLGPECSHPRRASMPHPTKGAAAAAVAVAGGEVQVPS